MLEGDVAIITGGARGIGFAIAKKLVSQGVEVVICSRTQDQIDQAVSELSANGQKAFGVTADVSNFEDCQKLVDYAYALKNRVDVLINNAGIFGPIGLLEETDPKDWQQVLAVNLLGAVYCSKLVIPYMKKQKKGKIINLAGAGAGSSQPLPRFLGYRASKDAVVSFTESLAEELHEANIQVNAIAPGAVASELTLGLLKMNKSQVGDSMFQTSENLKEVGGTPPELTGELVAFLVSSKADHITGRLLSAKWDKIENLENTDLDNDLFKLRRIDGQLFNKK